MHFEMNSSGNIECRGQTILDQAVLNNQQQNSDLLNINHQDDAGSCDESRIPSDDDEEVKLNIIQFNNEQNNTLLIVPDEGNNNDGCGDSQINYDNSHNVVFQQIESVMIQNQAKSLNKIEHKESCNIVEEDNSIIGHTSNQRGGSHTVGELLKLYKNQMPQAAASTNPRKNPLLKRKGQIMEDWSMSEGVQPFRSMQGDFRNVPYKTLQNFQGSQISFKTKTMVHQVNFSSFNYSMQHHFNNDKFSSSGHSGIGTSNNQPIGLCVAQLGGGLLNSGLQGELQDQLNNEGGAVAPSQSVFNASSFKSFKNSSDTLAYANIGEQNNQARIHQNNSASKDLRQQGISNDITLSNNRGSDIVAEPVSTSNNPPSSLRTSHVMTPSSHLPLGPSTTTHQHQYRSQTPQLRQRKPAFPQLEQKVRGDCSVGEKQDENGPVSKLSNFILQLYNRITKSDKNSSQDENEKRSRYGSEEIAKRNSQMTPEILSPKGAMPASNIRRKSAFKNSAKCLKGYSGNLLIQSLPKETLPKSKFSKKRVVIQEESAALTSNKMRNSLEGVSNINNCQNNNEFDEEIKQDNLKIEASPQNSSDESSGNDDSGRNKYKKWQTEQAQIRRQYQHSQMINKKQQLAKMMTLKEVLIAESTDNNKLATSKSYIYMAKGLSEEIFSDQASSHCANYRSAFFENDKDLEDYHKQVKEALLAQFQKEINISSHAEVKRQYEGWVQNYQQVFFKKSQFKKTLVFDLDETLVRVQRDEPQTQYDTRINVVDQQTNTSYFIYVKLRPYLLKTLVTLRKHYELILFTAASDQYAEIVLQSFEGHQYFDHILSRRQCLHIYQKQVFIKDLSILLGGRVLQDIIIVDNKIESYSSNLENGIPIISYYGEDGDIMLKKLAKYLMKLSKVGDVRDRILQDFYLKALAGMQKSNVSRLFDTNEIKACVLKSRDQQYIDNDQQLPRGSQPEQWPNVGGHQSRIQDSDSEEEGKHDGSHYMKLYGNNNPFAPLPQDTTNPPPTSHETDNNLDESQKSFQRATHYAPPPQIDGNQFNYLKPQLQQQQQLNVHQPIQSSLGVILQSQALLGAPTFTKIE